MTQEQHAKYLETFGTYFELLIPERDLLDLSNEQILQRHIAPLQQAAKNSNPSAGGASYSSRKWLVLHQTSDEDYVIGGFPDGGYIRRARLIDGVWKLNIVGSEDGWEVTFSTIWEALESL